MSKLIKPSEYAKQCGISRQAVYAKIKKGLLNTKKVDGKIYIEIDGPLSATLEPLEEKKFQRVETQDIVAAKDETIKILKETIADLKKTNHLIVGTLKGEVELLKEAFNEMQKLYRTQIESLRIYFPHQLGYNKNINIKENFIELKELAKRFHLTKEQRRRFKRIAKKMIENRDFRFLYIEDEVYALKNADYSDFLKIIKNTPASE